MKQNYPRIIQGGMGVAVSQWPLAREVAQLGQLGVVSLVGIAAIISRQLQDGDPGGHLRRAISHFPVPEVASRVVEKYFIPGGRRPDQPYRPAPFYTLEPSAEVNELTTVAAFAEVFLAKEGHKGMVGLNTLEKLQLTHLPTLFGAILAGVDVVIIGAGIPSQIPAILDKLSRCEAVTYEVAVHGAKEGDLYEVPFDPRGIVGDRALSLKRPAFFPIVSSVLLADFLVGACGEAGIDAFVVERHIAGGHNAPPRGRVKLNERGEPVYGPRDEVSFERMRRLGRPFYWAGGCSDPEVTRVALSEGAVGIQVGTIFALCEESGFVEDLKATARQRAYNGQMDVLTNGRISPSGFPFKTALVPGTLIDADFYLSRKRLCDVGAFREVFVTDEGEIGYRCTAEPVDRFEAKKGALEATEGRGCLCNALSAAAGLGQLRRDGYKETPLMTLGNDTSFITHLMGHENDTYHARDAIAYLEKFLSKEYAEDPIMPTE